MVCLASFLSRMMLSLPVPGASMLSALSALTLLCGVSKKDSSAEPSGRTEVAASQTSEPVL